MENHKAQTGIEFFILVIATAIIFSLLLGVLQVTLSEKTREKNDLRFKETALTIQNEINLAADASDGYKREFYIPQEVIGRAYEISIIDSFLYLRTLDEQHSIALEVPYVVGNITKGTNIIRKVDGQVFLNS